jgi:hypothetical protein
VTRFQGRPFLLLGVNSDPDKGPLLELEQKGTVTWRSWWDGRPPEGGRILKQWGIEAFPAVYIIDHRGIVRHGYLGARDREELGRVLTPLLEEAEAERGGS